MLLFSYLEFLSTNKRIKTTRQILYMSWFWAHLQFSFLQNLQKCMLILVLIFSHSQNNEFDIQRRN